MTSSSFASRAHLALEDIILCVHPSPAHGFEYLIFARRLPRFHRLELSQADAVDDMVGALAQDEVGALAGGQHVFAQVHEIDRLPDAARGLLRLLLGERGIAVKIGSRIAKGGALEREEAGHIP